VNQLPKDGVHIVGVGGAGMSAIARVLVAQGYRVSGSDAKDSKRLLALKQLGISVYVGHDRANLANAKVVIASTAIPATNTELIAARELGIAVLSRAEALASIVASHQVVAVAGTHGKTTTTSMLTVALQSLGMDPSFIIGSELNETGSNGHFGEDNWFLVEADESDGSFLSLCPELGIITNVEADHLDRWDSFASIQAAFIQFAANCSRGVVLCLDDPGAAELLPELRTKNVAVVTYGFSNEADLKLGQLQVDAGLWKADLSWRGESLTNLALRVPGRHNLLNAAAVIAAALVMELDSAKIISGLKTFTGTRRRFEFRGSGNSVSVYDDYAHHPTEVEATLKAARTVAGAGQVVVVFQPFRYYRVDLFLTEFATALALADRVAVMETYAPGEAAIPGAGGAAVAAAIKLAPGSVIFEPSFIKVVDVIVNWAQPGDIVLTLGAGDMAMLAPQIADALKRNVNG
jgi:UDP-N-acetylmuramate--alanine ligase